MVDNQAIVIPETIDAIRAITRAVQDGRESIARTDAALGIESPLIGAAVPTGRAPLNAFSHILWSRSVIVVTRDAMT